MTTTIFVTGATGTIGNQTVKALAGRPGVAVRAGVRDQKKGQALGAGVTPVAFDYAKPEGWAEALRGVDALYLMTPPGFGQVPVGNGLVDAAKRAGVRRVVRLSVIGADAEPGIALGREHRQMDEHLQRSGLEWALLRPNSFMQNFINYYPPDASGRIHIPVGDGANSFVDAADVGAAAAAALLQPGAAGRPYVLTGPEAITIGQAARAIGEASGRDVQYVDVPPEAAREAMLSFGMPADYVEGLLELYAIMKAGYCAAVSPDFEALVGRRARAFSVFARENAAAWRR